MVLNPTDDADNEGAHTHAHRDTLDALLSIDARRTNMFVALGTCSPAAQAIARQWLPNLKDHSLIHVDHLRDSIQITKEGQVKIDTRIPQHIEKGWDEPHELYVLSHTDANKMIKTTPAFDIHTALYFYAIPDGYSISLQLYASNASNAAIKSTEVIVEHKEYIILPHQCYSIEVAAAPASTPRRTSSSKTRRSGFLARAKHSRRQRRLRRAEIREQNKKLQKSLRYVVLYAESGEGVPFLDRTSYRLFPVR